MGALDPAAAERVITEWLATAAAEHPYLANIERDPTVTRWYVRLRGEEKSVTTVWLTLRERTLAYETYFMPAPEENHAACYEYLLRTNTRLYGMRFSIGAEDAVYLTGQMPQEHVDAEALDTVIGAAYHYSEECFPTAMRIGYASHFRPSPPS